MTADSGSMQNFGSFRVSQGQMLYLWGEFLVWHFRVARVFQVMARHKWVGSCNSAHKNPFPPGKSLTTKYLCRFRIWRHFYPAARHLERRSQSVRTHTSTFGGSSDIFEIRGKGEISCRVTFSWVYLWADLHGPTHFGRTGACNSRIAQKWQCLTEHTNIRFSLGNTYYYVTQGFA